LATPNVLAYPRSRLRVNTADFREFLIIIERIDKRSKSPPRTP
jgi:hypothetical protein